MHIGGSRGEDGTLKADIFSVGCLPKADTRRQGEGGGVKNPIFEETSFMDVPLLCGGYSPLGLLVHANA